MIDNADHANVATRRNVTSRSPSCGLFRVRLVELAGRTRNAPEILFDQFQRRRLLKSAGDNEQRIIGLIKALVEFAQLFDRDPLNIATVSDGRLAVVMPLESSRHHPLAEHAHRGILAPFELIANHRHLRGQIFPLDETVDHAICFRLSAKSRFSSLAAAFRNNLCGRAKSCH